MKDVPLLAMRVIAGGALVVAFAMLSDTLKPKTFAGLFSAAPSVATASLLVSGLATGPAKDQEYAWGMLGGAIGLVFYSRAGVIGMKFGPVLGGVWLGFPAILPASLTLIEKKEGKEAASVDSIGAILGAIAMIAFAIVVSLAATRWGVVPGLVAALAVWLVV